MTTEALDIIRPTLLTHVAPIAISCSRWCGQIHFARVSDWWFRRDREVASVGRAGEARRGREMAVNTEESISGIGQGKSAKVSDWVNVNCSTRKENLNLL